jgi:acyl dehydratase
MNGLAELEGHGFGPNRLLVGRANIDDFVAASSDDAVRWGEVAPPGFVAAGLFMVAPDLLGRLGDLSVIHGEQTFTWHRPIESGMPLDAAGTVSRVRERGGTSFIGFDLGLTVAGEPVAEGSSLFLVSDDFGSDGAEPTPEPHPDDDGSPGEGELGVSRAGLVRYAAASRDWNPIHWDHDTAVAAGLPGVIAHGLLQAAWAFGAASRLRPGDLPLQSARVRFRNPLPPATPVRVEVAEEGGTAVVAIGGEEVEYLSARIELAGR